MHGPEAQVEEDFGTGKIVGSTCTVSGVLVMALPIPIVVDNFGNYYAEQKKIEAKELKKEAQDKQAEVDKAAEKVANNGLVKTLSTKRGIIKTPSLTSLEDYSKTEQTKITSVAYPRSCQRFSNLIFKNFLNPIFLFLSNLI